MSPIVYVQVVVAVHVKSGELSENHYGHSVMIMMSLVLMLVILNCEEVFDYTSSVQSGVAMLLYRISHLRETFQEWTCTCTSQEWTCTGFHI